MTAERDELEPIEPREAFKLFLDHKATSCAEATVRNYRYRMQYFLQWCEEEKGIDNLNGLTRRDIQRFQMWRNETMDLEGTTLRNHMCSLRVFIASWVPVVLTAAFPTSGHVDHTVGTLIVDDTEVRLNVVSAFRTLSVGTFTVCQLSYTRGVPTAPRIIILPSNYLDVVSELIKTDLDASKRECSMIDRSERLIAGLFGLGMVALGPVLWLILPPGDGQAVALYAGAMFGLFGIMLLWYAYSA